jgi:hypothetical protein
LPVLIGSKKEKEVKGLISRRRTKLSLKKIKKRNYKVSGSLSRRAFSINKKAMGCIQNYSRCFIVVINTTLNVVKKTVKNIIYQREKLVKTCCEIYNNFN